MKILVFGANGFIGSRAYDLLRSKKMDVIGAGRDAEGDIEAVDLFDKESIKRTLDEHKPDVIVSCAGIVENSEKAILSNPIFTLNIIQSVIENNLKVKKILISGSAGEYGIVGTTNEVGEATSLLAENNYARSKVLETSIATSYKNNSNLPIYIYRPFNPIGPGMHPRFLIPNVIKQLREQKKSGVYSLEISRKDALRDYVDVRDIASAIHSLIEKDLTEDVYNIGSGVSTSNEELINLIGVAIGLEGDIVFKETQKEKEPLFAVKADISRLKKLGWEPIHSLAETIQDIVKENK
jgi:nucleoside-diphosphate-sugar epimerase